MKTPVHRFAVVLDPSRKRDRVLAATVQDAVDDIRDVPLPGPELDAFARRQPRGRRPSRGGAHPRAGARSSSGRRCRRPDDEVEQRRRELVRAGLASLPEEHRNERRLGVGRRLLLVLAVVPGTPLAAEEPEDGDDDEKRRDGREAERDEGRSDRMRLRASIRS